MKTITKKCSFCDNKVVRRPSEFKSKIVACGKECLSKYRLTMNLKPKITKPCCICGKLITRVPSQMLKTACCKGECFKKFSSKNLSQINKKLNPSRMTPQTREKLRNTRLGSGESKTYTKTYGRHTHRIIAEEKLGRSLLPGEVVHHIDENKRNNDPENLIVFSSQAEHAKYHMDKRHGNI